MRWRGSSFERVAYRRLLVHNAARISLLITALGVSIFLQNLFMLLFTSDPKTMPTLFGARPVDFGGITLTSDTLINIVVSVLLMVGLQLLVRKTKIGKAMQATSEDAGAAKLMGINTNSVVAFTFAIGSALAAVGAMLYCNSYPQIKPDMGNLLGLKAFVAAVLGGIGSIPGAMLGGYVLGVVESLTKAYISTTITDAVVFAHPYPGSAWSSPPACWAKTERRRCEHGTFDKEKNRRVLSDQPSSSRSSCSLSCTS